MPKYIIGDAIYENRISRGYSQEELSFGICSSSSLSRIESGTQIPGKRVFDALMQRLGVSDSFYNAYISKEEMELYGLTQKLAWGIENVATEEVQELMRVLSLKITEQHIFEKQYLYFAQATVKRTLGRPKPEILDLLIKAIHITMPDYGKTPLRRHRLLTFAEISILNMIAITYLEEDKVKDSLQLLYGLKEYLEQHVIDEEEKAKKYPMIVYNITKIIGSFGRYEDAYRLCKEGVDFCTSHNKLSILPYLLTNQACAAAELNKKAEARTLFHQAVTTCSICKKDLEAERIKEQAASNYGIEL